MKEKTLKVGERGINIILIILSLLATYESSKISFGNLTLSSPGAFPLIISILCLIFGVWIFGEKLKASSLKYESFIDKFKDLKELLFEKDVVVMIIFLVLYCLLLGKLGFTITTFIFLWLSTSYLTKSHWKESISISIIGLGFILLIFKYLFKVILP